MNKKQFSARELGFYFSLAQIGTEMVLPIGAGVLFDHYFNTSPWGIIVGAVGGFSTGMIHLLSMLQKHAKESSDQNKEP
ncbi:MAG: AtpZ/AtpI family protein [Bdellovibrionales bacterium]